MVIQCPECGKKYKIDPDKVPDKGAKISCPGCGHNFVVKKKEKEGVAAPKLKTPPCQMCGNPSTRVLKGDPPMVLCEACFEREKEKRRRFEVQAGYGVSNEPASSPAPEVPAGDAELTTEPAGPGADDYFDSFDAVPDMGDVQPEVITTVSPSPPPPSKPAAKTDARAGSKPPENKYVGREEALFDERSFGESPAPESKPAPEPERAKPEPKPEPEPPHRPMEQTDSDFIFSPHEVSKLEDKPPAEEPATERPSAIASTYTFTPSAAKESLGSEPEAPAAGAGDMDKEIFGDIAAKSKIAATAAAPASAKKVSKGLPIKIPIKAVIGIAAAIVVLAGGYFVITNPGVKNAIAKIKNGAKPAGPKTLTDEDLKLITEHINMAQDLYHLDTKKNYMDALNEVRAALKLDPQSKKANELQLLISALLAFREQSWFLNTRAKTLLKKADGELMSDPDAQAARALIYLSTDDFSAAKMNAEKLVGEHPENALANWILGRMYFAYTIKDTDKAESFLKKAVELDPKLTQAHFDLGDLYFTKKNYDQAAAEFNEVLKISPDRAEASDKLAAIQAAQKQPSKPSGQKPGEHPPGLLLTQSGGTAQHGGTGSGFIPIGTTQPGGSNPAQTPAANIDQEVQNHLFGVINETRIPMSRVRAASEGPAQPGTGTGSTVPRPPGEVPGTKPPEEAP